MRDILRRHTQLILFIGALGVRLGWVLIVRDRALSYSDDSSAYHDLAVNLADHHRFATAVDPPHRLDAPYAQRPPLTPFILASAYSVFGARPLTGQVVLVLFGSLSVVAVYLVGVSLFSWGTAVIAGGTTALYPLFVFLSAVPLTENLAILLYTLLAMVLVKDHSNRSPRAAAIVGLLLGLASLNRPQILGFFPFLVPLCIWDGTGSWLKRVRWLGIVTVCWIVVLAPWTVRNHKLFDAWIPISLQGGTALYEGNNPLTSVPLAKLRTGARGWYDDPRTGIPLAGLSQRDADGVALRLALGFMREHPGQTIGYSLEKAVIFFSAYSHPAAQLSWFPVFALSILGFLWSRTEWRKLLPVYLLILETLLVAMTWTSMPRFRAPVEPFFILMAAFAMERLWQRRGFVSPLVSLWRQSLVSPSS